jgi:hypothetical protein
MVRSHMIRLFIVLSMVALTACSGNTPTPTAIPTSLITTGLQIPHFCSGFSADDSRIMLQYWGIYDVATGERLYTTEKLFGASPDNQYVAVDGEGVYNISTGELIFPLAVSAGTFAFVPTFSPDSSKVASYDGVYAVPSGEHIVSWDLENPEAFFSPNSRYITLMGHGVYDLQTGEQLFPVAPQYDPYTPLSRFNADSTRLTIEGDALYDVTTGTRLASITSDYNFSSDGSLITMPFGGVMSMETGETLLNVGGYYAPALNPDNTLAAASAWDQDTPSVGRDGAVYDMATGEPRFTYNSEYAVFSTDGLYLIAMNDGVYNVSSGERLYRIRGSQPLVQPNGTHFAIKGQAVYEVTTGERLYSIIGHKARFSPDGRLLFLDSGIFDVDTGARVLDILYSQPYFTADGSMFTMGENDCSVYHVHRNTNSVAVP